MKNNKEFIDKVVSIIEKPYFREMGLYGIDDIEEEEYILRKVYGFDIRITVRSIYDSRDKRVYNEYGVDGKWWITEYDMNGNRTYYENSFGNIIDKRNI